MKVYLDEQPDVESIIKVFIESLEPAYDDYGYELNDGHAEPLECRSRDGFIAHSHNCGGFDRQWVTDLSSIWGSGVGVGIYTQEYADDQYCEAVNTFIDFDAKSEDKAILVDIPAENRHYHWLSENGYTELAERMDEYCNTWLSESAVYYGYRAMYEGKNGIWHTLVIYACVNQTEYYSACGKGSTDMSTKEIKFRNLDELTHKLELARDDLESALG